VSIDHTARWTKASGTSNPDPVPDPGLALAPTPALTTPTPPLALTLTLTLTLTQYQDGWWDLCAGPHVEHTGMLPKDSIQLESIAGAYFFGDESRPMLQRIYGTAWDTLTLTPDP